MESKILERSAHITDIEKDLKDVNLDQFNQVPSATEGESRSSVWKIRYLSTCIALWMLHGYQLQWNRILIVAKMSGYSLNHIIKHSSIMVYSFTLNYSYKLILKVLSPCFL